MIITTEQDLLAPRRGTSMGLNLGLGRDFTAVTGELGNNPDTEETMLVLDGYLM
jgi:hypothetical protein